MQKTSTEVYPEKEDQEEEKDTQRGANAPVCEETHPIEPSVIAIPELSAQARYDHDMSKWGYVARNLAARQTRGRSAHRRTQHTQPNAGQTAPKGTGHASRSQTSQHTHAPLSAPPAPAQTVQDAIQTEIARQLTAYGVWPRRAGVLAAQARSAGRSLDDIRAMYTHSQTAHDPAALLAAMIANNAPPPRSTRPSDSTITAESAAKYTTGKYAQLFNRPRENTTQNG